MENITTITWVISATQALQYVAELGNMHATLPQPASGSVREFQLSPMPTGSMTTLRYTTTAGELVFEYNIVQRVDVDQAVCIYTGPAKDFGYGDVGPFHMVHQRFDIALARAVA